MAEASLIEQMRTWRRHLHQNPEFGHQETVTAAFVVDKLQSFGISDIQTGIGKTGVVASLRLGSSDRTIALRADMDCLPIHETTNLPYASTKPDLMHACGHDGHTTMLLGAAKYLSETKNFKGRVVLIFQPAEEGFAGAKAMIDDGLLERYPINEIYGMHNMPGLEAGVLAIESGPRLAAADNFVIEIIGKGAHGAMPSNSIDPIDCGASIIQNLQHIVSRNSDPKETLVITVASFNSGHANNVIPKSASLSGTIRYYNDKIGVLAKKRFFEVVNSTCDAFGAKVDINFQKGYPATINHKKQSEFAYDSAKKIVGNKASPSQAPMMGSEDFSYFLKKIPGCFAWIGNGPSASLHNPKYDFNDSVLSIGSSFLATIAEDRLS